MSADQTPAPPAQTIAYTPAWMLYVYADRAFLTFDGHLAATATCLTPIQEARIEGIFQRLTRRAKERTDCP